MTGKYEALWSKATDALSGVVAELTARFGGGTAFFDALDERMRDPFYFDALISRAFAEFPGTDYDVGFDRIVVSGRFGEAFVHWFPSSQWSRSRETPLLVPGDLRHADLPPFTADLGWHLGDFHVNRAQPPKYVFLDDSVYKFRTFNKIKQRIEEANGQVVGHIVLYDGSLEPQRIPSFYRWHPREGVKP